MDLKEVKSTEPKARGPLTEIAAACETSSPIEGTIVEQPCEEESCNRQTHGSRERELANLMVGMTLKLHPSAQVHIQPSDGYWR